MRKAIIIQGLALGDEGKGSMVDWAVREYSARLVVRFGGGPQCAHNVVLHPEDCQTFVNHHTFSQFGSGTLAGARTHLSNYMLVNPLSLITEDKVLESKQYCGCLSRVSIDPLAVIVTPFHRITNQYVERRRGNERHGSVGVGVGECRADALSGHSLRMFDLLEPRACYLTLQDIRDRKLECAHLMELGQDYVNAMEAVDLHHLVQQYFNFVQQVTIQNTLNMLAAYDGNVVFEGHQGVLLDEHYGLEPHRTWTACTFFNALALIDFSWDVEKIGVVRSYFTRHGAGPFPTEDPAVNYPEPHNHTNEFMGPFRQGYFDAVLTKYAIQCCGGIDTLAITHMDCWNGMVRLGDENLWAPETVDYRKMPGPQQLMTEALGLPASTGCILSMGPTRRDKVRMAAKEAAA